MYCSESSVQGKCINVMILVFAMRTMVKYVYIDLNLLYWIIVCMSYISMNGIVNECIFRYTIYLLVYYPFKRLLYLQTNQVLFQQEPL